MRRYHSHHKSKRKQEKRKRGKYSKDMLELKRKERKRAYRRNPKAPPPCFAFQIKALENMFMAHGMEISEEMLDLFDANLSIEENFEQINNRFKYG